MFTLQSSTIDFYNPRKEGIVLVSHTFEINFMRLSGSNGRMRAGEMAYGKKRENIQAETTSHTAALLPMSLKRDRENQ